VNQRAVMVEKMKIAANSLTVHPWLFILLIMISLRHQCRTLERVRQAEWSGRKTDRETETLYI